MEKLSIKKQTKEYLVYVFKHPFNPRVDVKVPNPGKSVSRQDVLQEPVLDPLIDVVYDV